MRDVINRALIDHKNQTGHEVQFQEEWEYIPVGETFTVFLFGAGHIGAAHARILFIDGSRFTISLRSRNPQASIREQEWTLTQGKMRQIRWSGGATIPPEKRLSLPIWE